MPEGAPETPCTVCCCTLTNKVLVLLFMVLLILAILLGNAVTLAVILGTKHFRTPHGYLKASLAVADLSVGVFVVPLSVYAETSILVQSEPEWTRSDSRRAPLHPCAFAGPVFAACTLVSISTIFLLSIERSIAVLRPLHKGAVLTRKRTSILIVASWLGSLVLAVSPMLHSDGVALEYNACSRMCNYARRASPGASWNILLLFPAFDFALLGGTVAVNALSLSSIRQHSKRRQRLAEADAARRVAGPAFSDVKAAKTIGALTLAFAASFSPIAVFVVGNVLGNEWCNFSFFAFWTLTTNSCCNALVYSIRDQKFRQRAQQLLAPLRARSVSKT
ncbi:beta-1 adrenergic receptor [Scleropages formosus]|uniref:beta-1 adrenergic receptor n=1 Tax=Scleropages formosus TaxID=113540 RepID=UPI0010FA972F|nr:beta-1 adrenergic receptor-like [Scleropages formosus]